MSKIEWDWRTWLMNIRCTRCEEIIIDNKVIKIFGKPYCAKCWERLTKK